MPGTADVCNMALSHLGVGREVSDLDTDETDEAAAFRVFFATALKRVLRDFDWPFARRVQALGLVTDTDDDDHVNDEWGYAYRYPSACAAFRRIQSGFRLDTQQSRVSFDIYRDATGKLILTDLDDAIGVWTHLEEDLDKWDPDAVIALSYLLAHYAAGRLIRDPKSLLGDRAWKAYEAEISRAQANAGNEAQPDGPQSDAEWTRARDGVATDADTVETAL